MTAIRNWISTKYSKQSLLRLFFNIAFPLHLASIYTFLRYFEMILDRSIDLGYTFGVGAYIMAFTLIETLIMFLITVFVGMFTPQKWSQGKLVLILSVTFFIMTLWGIAGQSPNFIETSLKILTQVNTIYPHPYQNAFIGLFLLIALITTSIVVPNKYILQSPRFFQIVENITEKTVVLSILYLCFDFIGIGIIIFRNT